MFSVKIYIHLLHTQSVKQTEHTQTVRLGAGSGYHALDAASRKVAASIATGHWEGATKRTHCCLLEYVGVASPRFL